MNKVVTDKQSRAIQRISGPTLDHRRGTMGCKNYYIGGDFPLQAFFFLLPLRETHIARSHYEPTQKKLHISPHIMQYACANNSKLQKCTRASQLNRIFRGTSFSAWMILSCALTADRVPPDLINALGNLAI